MTQLSNRSKIYGLIFLAALVVRLAGFFICGIETGDDGLEYDAIGYNLAQGHGYSLSQEPPFELTTQREPAYPLFLAFIYNVFGHNMRVVIIIQCLLGSLVCVLIYNITLKLYNDGAIALLAAMINVFYLPIAIFNLRLLSETTAILFTGIIAYNLVQIFNKKKNWFNYAVLGIVTGFLILNKLAFQLFPAFILIIISILFRDKKIAGKILLCILLIIVIMAPWLVFNKKVHGSYALGSSVRMGANFYIRVFNDGLKGPLDMRTSFYRDLRELENSGVDAGKINSEYLNKAVNIIREHPWRYLGGIFLEIKDLWRFSVYKEEIDTNGKGTLQGFRGKIYLGIKYVFLVCNFIVLLTGIAGFFIKINKKSVILMSIIFYSTAIFALFSCALPRHNVCVLQLMIIFSSYFIMRIYRRINENNISFAGSK